MSYFIGSFYASVSSTVPRLRVRLPPIPTLTPKIARRLSPNSNKASLTFVQPSNTPDDLQKVDVNSGMKDLTRSLLSFVLIYGTKDKVRFRKHALTVLERYPLDEDQKSEIIDFAYEFFHEIGQRMNQVDMISRGVRSGVSDLEDRLSAILEKLETVASKQTTDGAEESNRQTAGS